MSAVVYLRSSDYRPDAYEGVTAGACVTPKSGGPNMLVLRPSPDVSDVFLCAWLLDDCPTLTSEYFHKDALRVVAANPTCDGADDAWSNAHV